MAENNVHQSASSQEKLDPGSGSGREPLLAQQGKCHKSITPAAGKRKVLSANCRNVMAVDTMEQENPKETIAENKVFICNICGIELKWKKNLYRHVRVKHGDTENNLDLKKQFPVQSKKPKLPTHKCEECSANYKYKCHLLEHKKTHSLDLLCAYCGKRDFQTKRYQVAHVKMCKQKNDLFDKNGYTLQPCSTSHDENTIHPPHPEINTDLQLNYEIGQSSRNSFNCITAKNVPNKQVNDELTTVISKATKRNIIKKKVVAKKLQKRRRQMYLLRQKLKRRESKIHNLQDIINVLKDKVGSSDPLIETLENNFSGFRLELLVSMATNTKLSNSRRHYTLKMKEFALTLFFYSPKAFRYCRKMGLILPNPRTISKWLSKLKCAPGLLTEVFVYLKENISKDDSLNNVSLIFDAMSIRKQLVYDSSKGVQLGYVDLGGIDVGNSEEVASEALVFQIVSLKKQFKCVVAYFFINKIEASVLSQLIRILIEKLLESNMRVRNVTCDGPTTNLSALKLLGCILPDKPWFTLPNSSARIYVTLDSCHMIKLCRNTLNDKGPIESVDGLVDFKYMRLLNDLQNKQELSFTNKITDKHIYYEAKKMNVRLAVQVLSAGVADGLEFLLKMGNEDFKGAEATIRFIRIFDRLFDLLNSRNPKGKNYKEPLRPSNLSFNFTFLEETINYIKSLKLDGIEILKHARKTFALGFITNINTLICLSSTMLTEERYSYLLTYKFSQDNLELVFSCIRSMGGFNNNPNVVQFQAALRKLLFTNNISPENGNCMYFEDCIQSAIMSNVMANQYHTDYQQEDVFICSMLFQPNSISNYQQNILYYISGYISRSLVSKLKCQECIDLIVRTNLNKKEEYMTFISFTNMGKLVYPTDDVYKLVCYLFMLYKSGVTLTRYRSVDFLVNHACTNFNGEIFKEHGIVVECGDETHELHLMKSIAYFFLKICIRHTLQLRNIRENPSSTGLRQRLTKLILFNNT